VPRDGASDGVIADRSPNLPFSTSTLLFSSIAFHSIQSSLSGLANRLNPIRKLYKMGLITRTLKLGTYTGLASVGAFFWYTRNDRFVPMSATDPIFAHALHQRFNPQKNPTTHDLCIRRVPLSDINPSLLEKKGKLVEAFCAGLWSGWGALSLCYFSV
jgi:hypothetical protein